MSPSSGPEEQQRWCAHGWVVMARFLCRGPTAHPLLPQKPEERWAVGKFATSPSHDQPFPRAVEWRRGDGGGRAGGGLWAHRQREMARNKHQREEPVSEEMNQTAKREFSRTQGIF